MKKKYILLFSLFISYQLNAQSIIGKYKCQLDCVETIYLNKDSTFYFYTAALTGSITNPGKWHVNKDTLILNSFDKDKQYEVQEYSLCKSKKTIFYCFPYGNYSLRCKRLYVITDKDTIEFKDLESENHINNNKKIQGFFIVGLLKYKYPTYKIKDITSNIFAITIKAGRFFDNEKWLIEGENIRPKSIWEDKYADYLLKKVE